MWLAASRGAGLFTGEQFVRRSRRVERFRNGIPERTTRATRLVQDAGQTSAGSFDMEDDEQFRHEHPVLDRMDRRSTRRLQLAVRALLSASVVRTHGQYDTFSLDSLVVRILLHHQRHILAGTRGIPTGPSHLPGGGHAQRDCRLSPSRNWHRHGGTHNADPLAPWIRGRVSCCVKNLDLDSTRSL